MFEFYLKNKHYIPDHWEELTPDQFINLVDALLKYRRGELDYMGVKVYAILSLLGLRPHRMRDKEKEQRMDENIYRLTRHVNFFFRIEYQNKKTFASFSDENKRLLKHMLPEDIDSNDPELRVAQKMNKWYEVDAVFAKNMLPEIQIGRRKYQGYIIDYTDGIAITTLTAAQFADAQTVFNQIAENPTAELLSLLVAILYQDDNYNEHQARQLAPVFNKLTKTVKQAVYLNFSAIQEFIVTKTKYSILFKKPKKQKKASKKYDIGLNESIYQLSKAGYGAKKQMQKTCLFEFFDMMIKELQDAVTAMHKMEKDISEIANEANLTITQVKELLP